MKRNITHRRASILAPELLASWGRMLARRTPAGYSTFQEEMTGGNINGNHPTTATILRETEQQRTSMMLIGRAAATERTRQKMKMVMITTSCCWGRWEMRSNEAVDAAVYRRKEWVKLVVAMVAERWRKEMMMKMWLPWKEKRSDKGTARLIGQKWRKEGEEEVRHREGEEGQEQKERTWFCLWPLIVSITMY